MTVSPRLVKGGLVTLDAATGAVRRVLPLQYNPDSVSRSLTPRTAAVVEGDRSEALRLLGPATETITLDAELDLTDTLEQGDGADGLHPHLAALEVLVNPAVEALLTNDRLSSQGRLEIVPAQAPLTVLVWSRHRVVPVRITQLTITEEAFDTRLNPIRARVALSLRVLTVDDLGFDHRGGALFMGHLRNLERLAAAADGGTLGQLGVTVVG
ncbi:hypothetical protein E8D34_04960 [Nocardioides sp. GY 10113]|uniref:hypothetical protein n=1 Tax=Nocardioides sp. GY 10113 TaxID=2569761 RepID=UPI0010A79F53|nr:hypothetical protein [Nocardioides sp. GY 10113]TIC88292.1 hypothetical protein E8D34_04960 [Nocardioides sp. GY 10113]